MLERLNPVLQICLPGQGECKECTAGNYCTAAEGIQTCPIGRYCPAGTGAFLYSYTIIHRIAV